MNTKKAVESHILSTALSLIPIGTHTHKKHSYACRNVRITPPLQLGRPLSGIESQVVVRFL